MINMIKADLYRIFRGKGIYIAIFIMLFMIAMSIYTVGPGSIGQVQVNDVSTAQYSNETKMNDMTYEEVQSMSTKEYRELMLETEGYELDRDILAANMNMYYIFIFIAALAVTVDFSGGCAKNTLSSAIDRKKYFLSKNVIIIGVSLLLFFLNTYISYFSNLIFNGKQLSSSLWTVTRISLLQLPPVLALVSVLLSIAFITKKTAIYNMVTIPLVLVFQMLLPLAIGSFGLDQKYLYYEIQFMFGKLAAEPTDRYIMNSYILCAFLIAISWIVGWLSFKKAEIK